MNTQSTKKPKAVATPCRMLHDKQHRTAVLKAAEAEANAARDDRNEAA